MEATTNTFIRWFNSDEIVPSKDGHYLCQTNLGRYATLPFSTKHQMFNVSEDNVETAIEVQWWAFLPELPQKEVQVRSSGYPAAGEVRLWSRTRG